MRNKILFIGVGGAGSIMADKAMRDYPELFDSVAIDCGINRELSCHQLSKMDRHPYGESAGFTTKKENVETLINENINEIKYSSHGDRCLGYDGCMAQAPVPTTTTTH